MENIALRRLHMFVLRAEIVTICETKMVTISAFPSFIHVSFPNQILQFY